MTTPLDRRFKIAGVVILYNPPHDVIGNITTYLPFVDTLFAVDNSERKNPDVVRFIKSEKSIEYIDNNENKGIAYALNIGANNALTRGFDFILTMDQDSSFLRADIEGLISGLSECAHENIGILSPYHENKKKLNGDPKFKPVSVTMTSGNLLSLNAYELTGPFNEGYFIDYVDHEYCVRLRKHGFSIIQANQVSIIHNLGNIKKYKFLGLTFASSNHSPVRRYYMMRNRLNFISRFFWREHKFCIRDILALTEESIKILLIEDHKVSKVKMSLRGVFDFMRGNYGKYRP